MQTGPSRVAEAIVSVFVPPACREEVLGDLYERYKSPSQYCRDALRTIPLVIVSRIQRTADPQVMLIQGCALYASFLGAAWLGNGTSLSEELGLLRVAVPSAAAMVGLVLEDAYAKGGRQSALHLARGPILGVGLALASQGIFRISYPDLAIPNWITFYGCAVSLILMSAVRMWFPPATDQLRGAHVSAHFLKQESGAPGALVDTIQGLKDVAGIFAVVLVGAWIAEWAGLPKPGIVAMLLGLLIVFHVRKRG